LSVPADEHAAPSSTSASKLPVRPEAKYVESLALGQGEAAGQVDR
jgi:hypothetical protein